VLRLGEARKSNNGATRSPKKLLVHFQGRSPNAREIDSRFGRWLKKTTDILFCKYDSDIPSIYNELIQLPGVGEKVF